MGTTARGLPYPEPGAAADIPADIKALADAVNALPPEFRGARAYRAADADLPSATVVAAGVDTEDFDTHDLYTGGSGILLKRAGWWLVIAQVYYAPNGTGERQAIIQRSLEGVGPYTTEAFTVAVPSAATSCAVGVATVLRCLTSADTVIVAGWQNSGAPLTVFGGRANTWMSAHYLGA